MNRFDKGIDKSGTIWCWGYKDNSIEIKRELRKMKIEKLNKISNYENQ